MVHFPLHPLHSIAMFDYRRVIVASADKDGSSKLKNVLGFSELERNRTVINSTRFMCCSSSQNRSIIWATEPHANQLQTLASRVIYSATIGWWIIRLSLFFFAISLKGITFEMEFAGWPLYSSFGQIRPFRTPSWNRSQMAPQDVFTRSRV